VDLSFAHVEREKGRRRRRGGRGCGEEYALTRARTRESACERTLACTHERDVWVSSLFAYIPKERVEPTHPKRKQAQKDKKGGEHLVWLRLL